jgi:hypothetical protein
MEFREKSTENLKGPVNTFGLTIDENQEYNKIP